ncbi:MAG: hypothetical protein WCG80_13215 [Spirochaetales bacterium]
MTFLDTNVVVYANDSRDERKQSVALELLSQLLVAGSGVVPSRSTSSISSAIGIRRFLPPPNTPVATRFCLRISTPASFTSA